MNKNHLTLFTLASVLSFLQTSCSDGQPQCEVTFDCDIGESCVDGTCTVVEIEELRIESFSANATSIVSGDVVELSWQVSGAQRCAINGETVACSGVAPFSPSLTTTYTLVGEDGAVSVFRDIEVEVGFFDAGLPDAGVDAGIDGGVPDAGADDAGVDDAGADDAGADDAGADDAGADDAGVDDAGAAEDAGIADSGIADSGIADSGIADSGIADADAGVDVSVIDITVGESFACVLFSDGSVKCWGENGDGQLGLGDTDNRGDDPDEMGVNLPAVDLGGPASAISAGGAHICALLADGAVKCWGDNGRGRLGLGDTETRGDGAGEMGTNLPFVNLDGVATAVFAAAQSTCALLVGGVVKCWGDNQNAQLGLGDTETRGDEVGEMGTNLPAVELGGAAIAISGNNRHTCALLNGGAVKCWGRSSDLLSGVVTGELGLGDAETRGDEAGEMGTNLPAVDLGGAAIAIGGTGACALLSGGAIKCWGLNHLGQLGLGDKDNRGDDANEMGTNLPVVDLGGGASGLSLGDSCAVLNDGMTKCWGSNFYGQLGLGDTDNRGDDANEMGINLPTAFLGGLVARIDGNSFKCALMIDGTVKCWGQNFAGQLGSGDTETRGDEPNEMGPNLPTVQLR